MICFFLRRTSYSTIEGSPLKSFKQMLNYICLTMNDNEVVQTEQSQLFEVTAIQLLDMYLFPTRQQ